MEDRNYTVCDSRAWAWGMSVLVVALMSASTITASHSLRGWAVVASAAAAVCWMRRFFIRHEQAVKAIQQPQTELMERAFSFGMEAGRSIPRQRMNSDDVVRPFGPTY